MSTGPQPRTAAANAARRAATEAKVQRVRDAIAQLRRRKQPITYPAVGATGGGVTHLPLRKPRRPRPGHRRDRRRHRAARPGRRRCRRPQEASWRERALNTEAALKAAHAEIRAQRDRIATLMGQARDAEGEWTPQAIGRITSENTTLKQRVRQLTLDNRTLQERLQAARSNVRFADRRIAQLEAQLLDHSPGGPGPLS